MDTRVLKFIGGAMVLLLLLGVGTAAAGVVYKEAQNVRSIVVLKGEGSEVDPESGLIVTSVDAEGPAAEAGVVRGDILLKIDDHEIEVLGNVQRVINNLDAGDQVVLTILHGDELRQPSVTLGERNGQPYLGVSLCCGQRKLWREWIFPFGDQKPLIIEVLPDTPAESAGLKEGDLILVVDGEEFTQGDDLGDIIRTYEPGDWITLELGDIETGETREVSLQLGEHPDNPDQAYLGVRYTSTIRHRFLDDAQIPWDEFDFTLPPLGEQHFRLPDFDSYEFDFDEPPFKFDWFFALPLEEAVHGEVILEVVDGSPADEADLRKNDVITALDGYPVEGPGSVEQAIRSRRPSAEITLTVFRPDIGERLDITIHLGEHPDKLGVAYIGVRLGPYLHLEHHEEGDFPLPFPGLRPKLPRTPMDV